MPPKKMLLMFLGMVALLLGLIGVFVPLLPTTPFVILAAWCFAQSSDRFHYWLIHHPAFGPVIRDWNARGAIPKYAKILAISMMSLSFVIMWKMIPIFAVKVAVGLFLLSTSAYILSRPS